MKSPFATALAVIVGLIVLAGFFIPLEVVPAGGLADTLLSVRTLVLDWAGILLAFATLVGVFGLVSTHLRRMRARRNPDRYSILLIIFFIGTVLYGLYAYTVGQDTARFLQIVNAVQIPVEASLMAVLAVVLTLASVRLFQRRRGIIPVVFVLSALLFLLMNSGLLASLSGVPGLGSFLGWLQILPAAGGRGILLGVALGSIMAGLRILFGAERPYSG